MRAVAVGALLLSLALAGCFGPPGNPQLRPPCADSSPIRIEVLTDKERYLPGELMNVTLALNNTGNQVRDLSYRSWELDLKSFDARNIKAYFREQDPDLGGATKRVPAQGRVVLQERWQPFRVTQELTQPLVPGTYYLCAVLVGTDGTTLASGAKPFVADPSPQTF